MSQLLPKDKVKIFINNRQVLADINDTVLSSLTKAGILVEAVCGGQGSCGKCRIKVLGGHVVDFHGAPAKPADSEFHLACQVYPSGDGDLYIENLTKENVSQKGEIAEISLGPDSISPPIKKKVISPTYPTLEKNYSLQEMIRTLEGHKSPLDIHSLKQLAAIASKRPEVITAASVNNIITSIEPGDTTATLFGVAFDIGTTTVAGMLVDLNTGKVIAAAAETNPQVSTGADVISRIKASVSEGGLEQLTEVIRHCLNGLIQRLCSKAQISSEEIYLVTMAGNSTMTHLVMGLSPECLSLSPYSIVFDQIPPFQPRVLGLDINPGGRILLLPNIASFVGADTVAAAVAVEMDLTSKVTLLIDLGTNGELVLGNKDKLMVCSTAAGPAFEGAQLSSGMRATDGAIDDVIITDDVYITTIKHVQPRGICGSGVIKAIAQLLRAGIITASGRFVNDTRRDDIPEKLRRRIRAVNGQKEFVLAFSDGSSAGGDITLTQGDIREIQLVKSSICTGAEILMLSLGINPEKVEQVLIAGAFGNYIDIDSAQVIGLIPPVKREKIRPVGNAAGTGAVKVLLSEKHLERCYKITEKAGFIELANHNGFQQRFITNLAFPEVQDENR